MVTFTVLAQIKSAKYFYNTKVSELCNIFSLKSFWLFDIYDINYTGYLTVCTHTVYICFGETLQQSYMYMDMYIEQIKSKASYW